MMIKKNVIIIPFLIKSIAFIDASISWLSNQNNKEPELTNDCKKSGNKLFWNAKIVDLVELVYALQEANVFNKGKIQTKMLINLLCDMFNLKMSDCFSHYMSIRNRPGSRTRFLDKLKVLLDNKMNKDDEEIHNRYKKK